MSYRIVLREKSLKRACKFIVQEKIPVILNNTSIVLWKDISFFINKENASRFKTNLEAREYKNNLRKNIQSNEVVNVYTL
jgi:hypothetical protein